MDDLPENPSAMAGGISQLDDDILQNIFEKLPGKSFASAACVSRSWNRTCTRILSHPKLCSAISLNPRLLAAMNEVVSKVLSAPIRPHFAILCVCPSFDLGGAHQLITAKLGSSIPIVTCAAGGIIGRDALTDQFAEVKFPNLEFKDNVDMDVPNARGISLTVGYVPGLKVDVVPLWRANKGHLVDKFLMEISDYSASVSGCKSPEAIIMFAEHQADVNPLLQKMDCAFSGQTIIAGNEICKFRFGSMNKSSIAFTSATSLTEDAVALIFVRDRSKQDGIGKIEFHFSVGTGVTSIGPTFKVASAKMRSRDFTTWLSARRQGENENLDGQQILENVDMELFDDYYVGVTKRRKCSIGSEKVKSVTSLVYHTVQDADEEYLYVCGLDIKTGDTFRFYVPDPKLALPSCETVSQEIAQLKDREIIGSFIFTCYGRGECFFEKPNIDSSPIIDNFPSVPIAGMFCGAEISRGPSISGKSNGGQEQSFSNVYSAVYLLLSYSPP